MKRWIPKVLLIVLAGTAWAGSLEGHLAYLKKDYKTALREFSPLAESGDSSAQAALGSMYYRGQGVEQNYKDALRWSLLAAKQGNAGAQYNLGLMYGNGHGVAQDYKEAARWFRLAAEQDSQVTHAKLILAGMYIDGLGVAQDYKEAGRWYRLAAEQGDAEAQFRLGLMYRVGQGVPVSEVVAYALFNLSAANDASASNKAGVARTEVVRSMDNSQIEAGQELTRKMAQGKPIQVLDAYLKSETSSKKNP